MTPRPILFMDTETTGLKEGKAALTQLAALFVHKRGIVDRIDLLIKPEVGLVIDSQALKIQGRTHAEILGHELSEHDACLMFTTFVNKNVNKYSEDGQVRAGGHNIGAFDLPHIAAAFERQGLRLPYEFDNKDVHVDTLKISQSNFDKKAGIVANHKLGTMCEYFSISLDGAHNAMADILATFELWLALVDYIEQKEAA